MSKQVAGVAEVKKRDEVKSGQVTESIAKLLALRVDLGTPESVVKVELVKGFSDTLFVLVDALTGMSETHALAENIAQDVGAVFAKLTTQALVQWAAVIKSQP